MVDNFDPQNEIMIGNRRLRKIKRPKQHNGPLVAPQSGNSFQSSTNTLQNDSNDQQTYQPQNQIPAYIQDDPYSYDNEQMQNERMLDFNAVEKKKVLWIAIACLFLGLIAGKFFFGTSQIVQNGLQGVVVNPEVPKGRSRCGVAEKTQGCVLYIMNPQRQELNGRDFYDWAAQLTNRQRFVIETGNMRYSSVKIKPGAIAQLNIPPLQ